MRFTWTLLEVLVVSSLIGIVLFWLSRKIRRKSLRTAFILTSGIVCGGGIGVICFVFFALSATVASDDVVTRRQVFRLDFFPKAPVLPDARFGMDPHAVLSPAAYFEAIYTDRVRKKEDFTVYVVAKSARQDLAPESYQFSISAPASAKIRTSYQCGTSASSSGETPACASPQDSSVKVGWDLTLTEPATANLVLVIPKSLLDQIAPSPKWVAIPSIGNEIVMRSASRSPFAAWRGGDPRDDLVPFVISPQVPYMGWSGGEFDMPSRQLRLRTESVADSGFSQATYAKLTGIGTALSGILGTGWLWQLLNWRRQRKTETHNPVRFE